MTDIYLIAGIYFFVKALGEFELGHVATGSISILAAVLMAFVWITHFSTVVQ